jgi:hypothetical protein
LTCGYDALRLANPQLASHLLLNCLYQPINPKKPNWRETMKTMKAVCTAIVLTLTLSVSAFAGDISTPGIAHSGGTSGAVTTTLPTLSTDATARPGDSDAFGDILLALIWMF